MQGRKASFVQALTDLEKRMEELRSSEADLVSQVEKLQVLIDPAEAELGQVEQARDGMRQAEGKARQALSMAERRNSQAQVALNRKQERLDTLKGRIEDDFGLVEFEYASDVSGPTPLPLGDMVEQLPMVSELPEGLDETIKRQRAQLRRMGAINPEAQAEYKEVKERFEFMTNQVQDLHQAEADIKEVIAELDILMEREFRRTFEAVAAEFRQIFTRLFGGGTARLVLTDPDDLTETGIDIEARLPGRRTQGLSLLSGGERSLTATALVFSLLKVSPTPFCVLDEVDAMLDEANVGRFRDLLRELSENTQFIVITHNRNTVQAADVIYGITMGRDSASQMISLKLDEVGDVVK
jgi:chromosome segregation protein